MDPDTDGDGYWDGWIGVYGVDHSENVILYREHLQSGGVSGAQAVPVQQEIHHVHTTPGGNGQDAAARSADIDDDGVQEHSTVHVGELHWGTNPLDTGDKPDPSITLEVGFLSQTSYQVWRTNNGNIESQWLEEIKENYALYDIEVTFSSKEVIDPNEMPMILDGIAPWNPGGPPRRANSPLSEREVLRTIMKHKTVRFGQTPYLLVADEPDFQYSTRQNIGGWNTYYAGGALREGLDSIGQVQGMVVFQGQFNSAQGSRSVAMHEIAHSFQIGEADDSCERAGRVSGGEIYSGIQPNDNTPEDIGGTQWSIMTKGPGTLINGHYYAFSIEELFTVEDSLEGVGPVVDNE